MLDKSDPSRRDNAKPLGIKSLTSNPAARADSKLPITGTTSNVAVTFAVVPKDTKYAVMIEVTMPYSKAEFDADKQTKYKKAVAKVALTREENIDITIIEARRRAGSIKVETKILAGSSKRLNEIKKTIGSDTTALLAKINVALKAEGLNEATGVSAPKDYTPALDAAAGIHRPSAAFGAVVAALVLMLSSFA